MIIKVEHIGIAVKSLEATKVFELILNTKAYKTETVETEKVNVRFLNIGESKMELLESTQPDGTISKYIEKKGEGIHHIALAVDDILSEMERLKKAGLEFIYEKPKMGADNQWINFIHPNYTHGVLIELCQHLKH